MNGMNTYIIRGTFVRILCAICRGNGFLVTPTGMAQCAMCRGEGMHK